MVEYIMAGDTRHYILEYVKHVPNTKTVFFELTCAKDKPDIRMNIRYMRIMEDDKDLFMISNIKCSGKSVVLTAMAEKEIEKLGERVTQSLYDLCIKGAKYDKENKD